jgi:hypothetical protein
MRCPVRFVVLLGLSIPVVPTLTLAGQPRSADEIVARNLEAKGGEARLDAVTTMRMAGTLTAGGQEVPMTIYMKRPNKLLQEMLVKGQRLVQAFDGQTAWVVNPLLGIEQPEVVTGPQAQAMRDQADFEGPLLRYRERGIRVEVEGTGSFEGRRVHRLRVTRPGGQEQRLDIDAETGLEVRSVMEVNQGDEPVVIETLLSDYRTAGGVTLPYSLRTIVNGVEQAHLALERIELSTAIDDGLFRKPD